MGLIREPLEVDFFFDPKPLTKKEQKMISDFIKADKEKRKRSPQKVHTSNRVDCSSHYKLGEREGQ